MDQDNMELFDESFALDDQSEIMIEESDEDAAKVSTTKSWQKNKNIGHIIKQKLKMMCPSFLLLIENCWHELWS